MKTCARVLLSVIVVVLAGLAFAQSELPPGSPQLINPEDLLKVLQTPGGEKPLILNVGPSYLYMQVHIPGAEYIGATSMPQGMQALRSRVKSLPKNASLVLYCGCCPWKNCPNVRPAFDELHKLGYRNVKVLYLPNNFGSDWVDKGYPTQKGQ